MKITKQQLRQIIREAVGHYPVGYSQTRSMLFQSDRSDVHRPVFFESPSNKKITSMNDVETVGDLKQIIKKAKQAKLKSQAKGGVADKAHDIMSGMLLDLLPGGATIKTLYDVIFATYQLPDSKRTGAAFDVLNIDDQVSAIVDDPIENAFIKKLVATLKNLPDDTRLEKLDMTKLLVKFIENEFDNRTITGFNVNEDASWGDPINLQTKRARQDMKITRQQLRQIIREAARAPRTRIPDQHISDPHYISTHDFKEELADALNSKKGFRMRAEYEFSGVTRLLQKYTLSEFAPPINGMIAVQLGYAPYEDAISIYVTEHENYVSPYVKKLAVKQNLKWPGNNQKALKQLIDELPIMMEQLLDKIEQRAEKDAKTFADKVSAAGDSDVTWSIAVVGKSHGYVTEAEYYDSKQEAIEAAKEMGGAYILKGTQMWNEPLGQVEEHDRRVKYQWVS